MRTSELNAWWSVVSAVANAAMRLVFRVRVEGSANVPSQGSAIVAFNHVSVLDGPCVGIVVAQDVPARSRFLVAAEVFDKRLPGWILRSFDQIPIRRGQGDVHALDEAIRTVKAGAIAAIAPEGRVNEDGATEMLRLPSRRGSPGARDGSAGRPRRDLGHTGAVAAGAGAVREAMASSARVRVRRGRGPARRSGRRRRPGDLHTAGPRGDRGTGRASARDRGGRMSAIP